MGECMLQLVLWTASQNSSSPYHKVRVEYDNWGVVPCANSALVPLSKGEGEANTRGHTKSIKTSDSTKLLIGGEDLNPWEKDYVGEGLRGSRLELIASMESIMDAADNVRSGRSFMGNL